MTFSFPLAASLLLNLLMALVIWRLFWWRRQTKSMMHAALKMAKKTSDSLRFVRLEPWRDECVQNATDGIDNLFSILYGSIYPNEVIHIDIEDTPPLPVPKEPGTD
jgi:hypothetical protein